MTGTVPFHGAIPGLLSFSGQIGGGGGGGGGVTVDLVEADDDGE